MATSTSAIMLICCFAQRDGMSQHVAGLPTHRLKVCAGRKESRNRFSEPLGRVYLDISNQKRA